MGSTITRTLVFEVIDCADCSVPFGLSDDFIQRRRKDGRSFYCPSGHSNVYHETEADRLRKEIAREKKRTQLETQRAEFWRLEEEKRAKALMVTKGQLTKTRKRVSNGMCPCCKRSFVQLARHMAGQHPNFCESIS